MSGKVSHLLKVATHHRNPASLMTYSIGALRHYYGNDRRQATTILCIRKGDKVVLAGDGQVTQQNMVGSSSVVKENLLEYEYCVNQCIKPNARKLRRLANGKVITGFAGSTADAFTLLERLEGKLDEHPGQLLRACVELAKMWRTDRYLRNLEAAMVVADENLSLEVMGNGDVLESHDGIIGIGSGGQYAIAAARALYNFSDLDARSIAENAMKIAADLCIYTNHNLIFEELPSVNRLLPCPTSLPPRTSSDTDVRAPNHRSSDFSSPPTTLTEL